MLLVTSTNYIVKHRTITIFHICICLMHPKLDNDWTSK